MKNEPQERMTPRVDAGSRSFEWWTDCWIPSLPYNATEKKQTQFVKARLAIDLERELSEALEEVERLKGELKTEQGLSEARTKALNKLWKEKLDAAEKMRGEALLALGTMQNERDAYASHIAKEGRISDSEMVSLLRRRSVLADELQAELATAERERDEARADCAVKDGAAAEFRDAVLNGRHQLESPCLDNDQTNAVLGLFDDCFRQALATNPGASLLERLRSAEASAERHKRMWLDADKTTHLAIQERDAAQERARGLEGALQTIASGVFLQSGAGGGAQRQMGAVDMQQFASRALSSKGEGEKQVEPQTVPREVADGLAEAIESMLEQKRVAPKATLAEHPMNLLEEALNAYRSRQAIDGRVE